MLSGVFRGSNYAIAFQLRRVVTFDLYFGQFVGADRCNYRERFVELAVRNFEFVGIRRNP